MKHALGESYLWQTTRSSDKNIPCKIVLVIPPRVQPATEPEKCRWLDGKVEDYYWGAMNTELYDFTTYAVAVDANDYFGVMGVEIPKNLTKIRQPVLMRPKDLYETFIPAPPTPAEIQAAKAKTPKSNGSKRTKKG